MEPMFEVDPRGLAQLVGRRGYSWVGFELLQNALDTDAEHIEITVRPVPGRPQVQLIVEDDSMEGFGDRLHHAWTLFAPSHKRDQAQLRGRFNAGEKLVLAICQQATIHTTSGTVEFADGRRRVLPRRKRDRGTQVSCRLNVTHRQGQEILDALGSVLVPQGVHVTVNDKPVRFRAPVVVFEVSLPTETAGDDGRLSRTRRRTTVRIVEPREGETPMLFELGIPVVEAPAGCPWHADVAQKIPLSLERDNVTPAYRRELAAGILNHTAALVADEQSGEAWISEALEHPSVTADTVRAVISARYGDKAVVYDPSDQEANHLAVTKGYQVVPGRAFSKKAWQQVRDSGVLAPAGQVTPSPKPFHPDGRPLRLLAVPDAPAEVRRVAGYYEQVGSRLLGRPLRVQLTDDHGWQFRAACGLDRVLVLSIVKQPAGFWTDPQQWDDLLIHEAAHALPGGQNHLSSSYHENLTRLGAKLTCLALAEPSLLRQWRDLTTEAAC